MKIIHSLKNPFVIFFTIFPFPVRYVMINLMKLSAVLDKYKFPSSAKKVYQQSGVENLFPPQAEAIDKGVLEGKNVLLSVPTAAGKTLIAELAMLRSVLQDGGHCLYIVPLKALASEKYEDFKNKFAPLGIRVGMATGDSDIPNNVLGRYHILISKAEKTEDNFKKNIIKEAFF
jgi:helicase